MNSELFNWRLLLLPSQRQRCQAGYELLCMPHCMRDCFFILLRCRRPVACTTHARCCDLCRYPNELKLLVIVLFMLTPLGMALCLLVVQGWDTRW